MTASSLKYRNRLLGLISSQDLDLLTEHLAPVSMILYQNFEHRGRLIAEICFPESGIISVVAHNPSGQSIEVGLIGFEGMTGTATMMGSDQAPHDTYVQMAGTGHVISVDVLHDIMRTSSTLHGSLLPYCHAFSIQTAQTALANGRYKVDERLARWLLMASDRAAGLELSLTHEFLSLMLGVRRPGVTDAMHRLEGDGLIRAKRSLIIIRDREGLERRAEGSYGVPEREYERIFGAPAFHNEMDIDRKRHA